MTTKVKSKVSTTVLSDEVIDIPGSSLLEWLINRKKIQQHWKRNHPKVLKLIESALLLDQQQNSENTTISPQELNYFECLQIFKDAESSAGGNATTLFGSYSNPKTQRWYEVINQYEKDYLNIGESCQIFTQNINYEIPDLKKIVDKTTKNLDDFNKREVDLNKSKSNAINAYKKSCSDLSIKGDNIREEIESLPSQLNGLYDEIINILQSDHSILEALDFYKVILKETKSEFDAKLIFPTTLFLENYGNITLLEREKILNPTIDLPDLKKSDSTSPITNTQSDNNNNNDKIEIDWCMDFEDNNKVNNLEFDESNVIVWEDGMDMSSPTIQWDEMDTIELVDDYDNSKSQITLSESPITTSKEISKVEKKQNKNKNNIDTDIDIKKLSSETILSDSTLRNQFLDEIFEIEIFLQHRISEMEKSNSMFGIDSINSDSTVSVQDLKKSLSAFQEILKKLSNNRIKQILEIKSSKKFVDRLVLQFTQKQNNIAKFTNSLVELDRKRDELNEILVDSRKKLDQITLNSKQLKSKLESLLSTKLFEKKKVNIIYKI